jgi:hypothetical protein
VRHRKPRAFGPLFLAICLGVLSFLAPSASAVRPYRNPSAKLKPAPLVKATSWQPKKLKMQRIQHVTPYKVSVKALPMRYTRARSNGGRVSK